MICTRKGGARGGFSLVELVVAIGIFALVVTLATVVQSKLLPHYRLQSATRQVMTDIRLARQKAIAQNAQFRITFTAGGNSYAAERLVSGIWEPYPLYRRGAATSLAAAPIEMPSTVTATSNVVVQFTPRGTVTVTGSPPIVLSAPGPRTRALSISVAGLVSLG